MKRDNSINKAEQKEALKVLADWTKWLVTLETGSIGAALAFAKASTEARDWFGPASAMLGIASLCYSIYWAVYLVYGIPEIIEQLPGSEESSINEMKSERLSYNLFTCQVHMYRAAAAGFLLCIVSVGYYAFHVREFLGD